MSSNQGRLHSGKDVIVNPIDRKNQLSYHSVLNTTRHIQNKRNTDTEAQQARGKSVQQCGIRIMQILGTQALST